MGSLTRKVRKQIYTANKRKAQRGDAVRNYMTRELAGKTEEERVAFALNELGAGEIRRRLQMSHADQLAKYGFAVRGGAAPEKCEPNV